MKKTRASVFETNSSSTHSICLAKGQEDGLTIPEALHFEFGDFGWEEDRLDSVHEKASYLYTAVMLFDMQAEFLDMCHFLRKLGIAVTYELPSLGDLGPASGIPLNLGTGHIDHYYGLGVFVEDICSDFEKAKMFLFSPLSYVLTGNDNSCTDVDIKETYPHGEYYKGN